MNRPLKILFKSIIVIIILLSVCGVCAAWGWWNTNYSISAKQKLWELREPSAYYMQVLEGAFDEEHPPYFHWEVYVESGRPVTTTLLYHNDKYCQGEYPVGCESVLDPDNLNMEQLFEHVNDFCTSSANKRDFTCEVEFDPWFHYPKRFHPVLYWNLHVTVQQFTPCEQVDVNCPPTLDTK